MNKEVGNKGKEINSTMHRWCLKKRYRSVSFNIVKKTQLENRLSSMSLCGNEPDEHSTQQQGSLPWQKARTAEVTHGTDTSSAYPHGLSTRDKRASARKLSPP
jgi:hypothetical protein